MKIFKDAISDETWKACIDELNANLFDKGWKVSNLAWPTRSRVGIDGTVLIKAVSKELRFLLLEDLKEYLPYCNSFAINMHVWMPNSGVATHNDSEHKYGATIYLNQNWYADLGGIFVWWDKNTNEMRGLVPECKTLVLNDEHEDHLVTIVSTHAPEPRISIQIFAT